MFNRLKRYLPKSLFGRTLLIMIVPVIVAQAVAVYIFYERHWENVSKYLARSLAGEISLVVNYVETVEDDEQVKLFLESIQPLFGMNVEIKDLGQEYGDVKTLNKFDHEIYEDELRSKINNQFRIYIDPAETEITTAVKTNDKVLLVKVLDKRLVNSTTYIFITWMIGTTFLLLAIALVFLKNQIRPIIRLARLANNFGRGQESAGEFKPEGAEEIRQAGMAFLSMKERIGRHIRQRTEMLAGISHDLRTPLTRMKLEIAMLQEKYNDENISELSQDIEEMEKMVSSYINFVRADEEEETIEINLKSFIAAIVDKYKQQGFDIEFAKFDNIQIMARERALRRAMQNIIENSQKYADSAKVYLKREMGNAVIVIDDDGSGIPLEEREEVFKAFHRVDNSRNRETGGSGLGLSIVRDIVNGHGGSVSLSEAYTGIGLKVTIKLPV